MKMQSVTGGSTTTWVRKGHKKHSKSVQSCRSELIPSLPDINLFECHQLIDSPRRVQFERTQLVMETPLSTALNVFDIRVATVSEKRLGLQRSRAVDLCRVLFKRISKRGIQSGLKIQKPVFVGSTHDGTAVVSANEVDILVPFDIHDVEIDSTEAGYYMIPLKPFEEKKGEPPDPFRFGRSADGMYLSSKLVSRLIYNLMERSLKYHPWAELLPFDEESRKNQIRIAWKSTEFFNFIPATKPHSEDFYLVAKPYPLDDYPASETLWRGCFAHKETKIIQRINGADRGMRSKAFKLLKALVKVEHTLEGLSSYHIKTVFLHSFDCVVDRIPRWHKDSVDIAFQCLLEELLHFLTIRNLPHFFINEYNLFGNIDKRKLNSLRARINYLYNNTSELSRLLGKHCKKFVLKPTIEEIEAP